MDTDTAGIGDTVVTMDMDMAVTMDTVAIMATMGMVTDTAVETFAAQTAAGSMATV